MILVIGLAHGLVMEIQSNYYHAVYFWEQNDLSWVSHAVGEACVPACGSAAMHYFPGILIQCW